MAATSDFAAISAALRGALTNTRPDVSVHESAAPTKVAPFALALGSAVEREGEEIAVGRFVLLHDPDGQPAWDGDYRIACFARAELDAEMGADPVLPEVTWSWLTEALAGHDARAEALAGTVTVTRSSRFGTLVADQTEPPESSSSGSSEVELRCSWSPRWDDDPARHLRAFCDLLADMAGLPPQLPGVVPLSSRIRR